MRKLLLSLALFPSLALAAPQPTSPPAKPEVVVLPLQVVSAIVDWSYHAGLPAVFMDAVKACLTTRSTA